MSRSDQMAGGTNTLGRVRALKPKYVAKDVTTKNRANSQKKKAQRICRVVTDIRR